MRTSIINTKYIYYDRINYYCTFSTQNLPKYRNIPLLAGCTIAPPSPFKLRLLCLSPALSVLSGFRLYLLIYDKVSFHISKNLLFYVELNIEHIEFLNFDLTSDPSRHHVFIWQSVFDFLWFLQLMNVFLFAHHCRFTTWRREKRHF